MPKDSVLVYSTDKNRPSCQTCGQWPCACPNKDVPAKTNQVARIALDRKGRGGKSVTLVQGLTLSTSQLEELAKKLKSGLATGGTVKAGQIEIQGDHRARVIELLEKQGIKTKQIGG